MMDSPTDAGTNTNRVPSRGELSRPIRSTLDPDEQLLWIARPDREAMKTVAIIWSLLVGGTGLLVGATGGSFAAATTNILVFSVVMFTIVYLGWGDWEAVATERRVIVNEYRSVSGTVTSLGWDEIENVHTGSSSSRIRSDLLGVDAGSISIRPEGRDRFGGETVTLWLIADPEEAVDRLERLKEANAPRGDASG